MCRARRREGRLPVTLRVARRAHRAQGRTWAGRLGAGGIRSSRGGMLLVLAALQAAVAAAPPAPAVDAPVTSFSDYRSQAPGARHRITVADLPAPYATPSSGNSPRLVPRPEGVMPVAPAGFSVARLAQGLEGPRVLRVAPNGDIFVAESDAGRIRVLRGAGAGSAVQGAVFAAHLNQPYGMAFYPPGPDPQWLYVGNTDEIVRFAYRAGDLRAAGPPEHVAALPGDGGHWTRDLHFSADGAMLFVGVGSASNVDDPDTTPAEAGRAAIWVLKPDGSGMHPFATGMRNPSGLSVDPATGQLWAVVNERDGLGDNLVPDYATAVPSGAFFGWPWWYMGPNQDPRHKGEHPQDRDRVHLPDVLLQPHSAPLQLEFYTATRFPAAYRGDIFLTSHGSWNRSVRTGYAVLRIHAPRAGEAGGGYEEFLTGFVRPDGRVWGRPVGIAVAADGALLVSDDASGSIWRVDYVGH